jgi:RND family efflux transporter MFP subunit
MLFPKKAAALAAGFISVLSAVTLAQTGTPARRGPTTAAETLVVEDAMVDWIEKSDVAALREGVVDTMELQVGMSVKKNEPIGYLHKELAVLNVAKSKVAVAAVAAETKAIAQKELAMARLATDWVLNNRVKGAVSPEEIKKDEAEVKVADAMREEAIEKRAIDTADLKIAERTLEEHTIVAPFDGIVIDRFKNPGESVRANEPVVKLGNLDKLRAVFYVPLKYRYRLKDGDVVEFQVKISGSSGTPLPVEQKRFRGKITFIDPQIQPVVETEVRIYAEVENKEHELSPGLKGTVTLFLSNEPSAVPSPAPTVGSRAAGPRILP